MRHRALDGLAPLWTHGVLKRVMPRQRWNRQEVNWGKQRKWERSWQADGVSLCGKGKARKLNWKHLIGLGSPGSPSEGEGVLKAAAPFRHGGAPEQQASCSVSTALTHWLEAAGGRAWLCGNSDRFQSTAAGTQWKVSYASCSQNREARFSCHTWFSMVMGRNSVWR